MDGPPPKKSKITNSPTSSDVTSTANSEYWTLLNDVNSKLPDELDSLTYNSGISQTNENHFSVSQNSDNFSPTQLLLPEAPPTPTNASASITPSAPICINNNLTQIVRYSTAMQAGNTFAPNQSPIILAANGQNVSSNRLQFVASPNRLPQNVLNPSGGNIRTVVSNGNRTNMMAIMMPNKIHTSTIQSDAANIVMVNGKPNVNTSMVWTSQGVAIVGSDQIAGGTSGAQRLITLRSGGMQKFVVINNSGNVTSCNATPIIQIARPQQTQVSKLRGVLAPTNNITHQQLLNNNPLLQHSNIIHNLHNNSALQNNPMLQGNILQSGSNLVQNNILQNPSVGLLQSNHAQNTGLLQNQAMLQNSSVLTNNISTTSACNSLLTNIALQQQQQQSNNISGLSHTIILNSSLANSSPSPSSLSASLYQQQHQALLHSSINLNNAQNLQFQQKQFLQIQQQQQQQQLHQQKFQQVQQLTQPHLSPTPIFSPTSGQMAADPEKRKLIRHQLVLLLHAHKCQKREQQANGLYPPCKLSHCQTMKNVLNHISECQDGKNCKVPHCASSRQIINHWRTCQRQDCGVCYPLRKVTQPTPCTPTTSSTSDVLTQPNANSLPIQRNPDMSEAYRLLGLQPPSIRSQNPIASATIAPSPPRNGVVRPTLDRTSLLQTPSATRLAGQLPGGAGCSEPKPTKAWHQSITQDLRNHLVQKLVQAIFPSPDYSVDARINSLIQYARKVEGDMYETADSQEHYYHLLAEKIYRIQKELEEKKLKRQQKNNSQKILETGTSKDSLENNLNTSHLSSSQDCADSNTSEMISDYTDFKIKKEEPVWEEEVKGEAINEEATSEIKVEAKPDVKPDVMPRANKIFWKPLELRQNLLPTLEKLYRLDESSPFRQPVDPILLNIPDYFDIIKHPIDMSTIKRKLDTGAYTDPWDYVNDIWLMFENAWLYNRKSSRVHKHATKMSEVFESEIDIVMRNMGYCCGRKYVFNPQALFCYGKSMCTIPINAVYYSHQNRYVFCEKCYLEAIGDELELSDDPLQPNIRIRKDLFEKTKNNQLELEPLVECTMCGRRQHQICALYFEPVYYAQFVCQQCCESGSIKRKENKFTAKRLPQTKLGTYLETRVNSFLKKNCEGAGEVTIRMLSSSEKNAEVKPLMKARFEGELPESFPYIAKSIFAFEEIEGVDVCFFGMHVQEYGSKCPAPNARHMYLAYLDSVNLFQPRMARTAVYHELLIGYFDYIKKLGYATVHIWACPPSEGDDYIFHCHPPDMKIPKPKRLQDWYRKMLDKATNERIVIEYKDILKDALESKMMSPLEMPYFEGDFWPTVLEDNIRELHEEEERKRDKEDGVVSNIIDNCTDLESPTLQQQYTPTDASLVADKKKGQKGLTKKKSSKNKSNFSTGVNQPKKSAKKTSSYNGDDLTSKLLTTMEKHKEVFFVVRLHSPSAVASLPAIQDPDPLITNELMDGRDAFLMMAREKHYEFSSLRRAKYSTMAMLYELHTQAKDGFVYTCNNCKANIETHFHCTVCDDFDLCVPCYEKSGHCHKMEKLGLDIDSDDKQATQNPQETRRLSIQRCIQSLVHACLCKDANCKLSSCQKMKKVMTHTKQCKSKQTNSCPICKQLIALCWYHAKHCPDTKCPVPFCLTIKQKLQQQMMQQRAKQAKLMRRRMATMQQYNSTPTALAQSIITPIAVSHSAAATTLSSTFTNNHQPNTDPNLQKLDNVNWFDGNETGSLGGGGASGGVGGSMMNGNEVSTSLMASGQLLQRNNISETRSMQENVLQRIQEAVRTRTGPNQQIINMIKSKPQIFQLLQRISQQQSGEAARPNMQQSTSTQPTPQVIISPLRNQLPSQLIHQLRLPQQPHLNNIVRLNTPDARSHHLTPSLRQNLVRLQQHQSQFRTAGLTGIGRGMQRPINHDESSSQNSSQQYSLPQQANTTDRVFLTQLPPDNISLNSIYTNNNDNGITLTDQLYRLADQL